MKLGAPKPKRGRKKAKRSNSRKELEKRLEALIRQIVWWRDGGKAIRKDQ